MSDPPHATQYTSSMLPRSAMMSFTRLNGFMLSPFRCRPEAPYFPAASAARSPSTIAMPAVAPSAEAPASMNARACS